FQNCVPLSRSRRTGAFWSRLGRVEGRRALASRRVPVVSPNQKRDLKLFQRTGQQDRAAEEELIRRYTPMIRHIVRRHYARAMDFDDLCQEGFIGLIQAIAQYDPVRYDVPFSSFAYLCIIRKVYNAIKSANGTRDRKSTRLNSSHVKS